MAQHVCPPWVGYFLINPFRKFLEDPEKMLGPYVREGMVVIEPGCGMGFFTIPLAKMVGPAGKVVALDIQSVMLEKVKKRARRAGLEQRIECRLVKGTSLDLASYTDKADLAVSLHVVHEVPDQELFFSEISGALKPGSKLLVHEPSSHVSEDVFEKSLSYAVAAGLRIIAKESGGGSRRAELISCSTDAAGYEACC